MPISLRLTATRGVFSILRLPADAVPPEWLTGEGFSSVTRTATELSIVCPTSAVPAENAHPHQPGWRMLRFEGPFEFSQTGILAAVAGPLAVAGIGIFVISTFDTDYLLVQAADFEAASAVVVEAGHELEAEGSTTKDDRAG